MVEIKRNFNEIIERHRAFIERKPVERPLYCVYVIGRGYAEAYKETFLKIPKGIEVEPKHIDISDYIKDVENFMKWHEEVGQDIFYPVIPLLYIPWTEAIIGCPVYKGKDSFYTEPFLKSWEDMPSKIDLSDKNKWFAKLIEMTEILVGTFGEIYPMGSSTHLRGPADMMAAAIGQRQFPLEIYDNPEKIKAFGKVCVEVFIEIARTVNKIASKAKFRGFVVNNYGIWTEKICQYYQDDSVAFLSPKFYKQFIANLHREIDNSFPLTLYHIHPISLFVVDELINFSNLKIIEINREPLAIGPSVEEMLHVFKKIQESNKALIINFTDIDFSPDLIEKETSLICKNLSYEGLCIYVCAEDIKDAYKKTESVKKIFKI